MIITERELQACLPKATAPSVNSFHSAINETLTEFQINTAERIAMFVAQIGHESGYLKFVKENLNYSAEGILKTFPKYFDAAEASQYARKPEAIANRVYANRMGNGPESSGDGFKFRGRGLIQVTGRSNYTLCSNFIGVNVVKDPIYLEVPIGASRSAGWFWKTKGLNDVADDGDIVRCTKIINGGLNGLEDRRTLWENALQVMT